MADDSEKAAEIREMAGSAERSATRDPGERMRRDTGREYVNCMVGETWRRIGEPAAGTSEPGAAAAFEAMRRLGETSAQLAQRSTQAVAEGQQRLMQSAIDQFEHAARGMTRQMRDGTEYLRVLFAVPTIPRDEIRDMQEVVCGLVEGVLEANLRASRELFRLACPSAVIERQQRFVREYLDRVIEGHETLVRSARNAMDQTLSLKTSPGIGGKRDVRITSP